MAWFRKCPIEVLKQGRSRELDNLINFDAFDEVDELPPRHKAYNMVLVDEWRADNVRSILCVSTVQS